MELRQLRYFVRVVEQGSMSRAALDLDVVQSALSQQITRLESELATRLLQRTPRGVTPTEAGLAFFREAQLTLRHADQAVRAAQQARLSGTVTVGLAPTTSGVLGLPLMQAMRTRYPDVRLHMVESMSGHLTAMLHARELDLAVLFDTRLHQAQQATGARRWDMAPLLEEDLFLICARDRGEGPGRPRGRQLRQGERFEQVVVGPGAEALQAVIQLVAGGEHDHRCIAAGVFAQALAQGVAIDAGQHDVEHDQVVVFGGGQVQAGQAILGAVDGVALHAQVVGQVGQNIAVVFNQKNAHRFLLCGASRSGARQAQLKAYACTVPAPRKIHPT